MNYCKQCGSEVVKKGEYRGSYSKLPVYFDEDTGKEIYHEMWECKNTKWYNTRHTVYFIDKIK